MVRQRRDIQQYASTSAQSCRGNALPMTGTSGTRKQRACVGDKWEAIPTRELICLLQLLNTIWKREFKINKKWDAETSLGGRAELRFDSLSLVEDYVPIMSTCEASRRRGNLRCRKQGTKRNSVAGSNVWYTCDSRNRQQVKTAA